MKVTGIRGDGARVENECRSCRSGDVLSISGVDVDGRKLLTRTCRACGFLWELDADSVRRYLGQVLGDA